MTKEIENMIKEMNKYYSEETIENLLNENSKKIDNICLKLINKKQK